MFCQTSMEAVIPALMDLYFRYDDMANSYLYLAAGLELLGKWESLPPSWICISGMMTWPSLTSTWLPASSCLVSVNHSRPHGSVFPV